MEYSPAPRAVVGGRNMLPVLTEEKNCISEYRCTYHKSNIGKMFQKGNSVQRGILDHPVE